ncbi:SGNH hydrolase-type esterase domain-containing protein [Apiospora arundinis]
MTRVTQLVGLLAFSSSLLSPLVAAQFDGNRVIDTTIDSRQVDGNRVSDATVDTRQVDGSQIHDTTVNWRRQVDGSEFEEDVEDIEARQVDGNIVSGEADIDARQVDGSSWKEGENINSRQVDGNRIGEADIDARQVDGNRFTDDESINARDNEVTVQVVKDFPLRIMPLGASITQGIGSSDGNGYRLTVHDRLVKSGWKVNMVGCKRDGNMTDNNNEGYPGYTIDQVHGKFTGAKSLKPNVVLLNAGTNDCAQNIDTAKANIRLKSLVDEIFTSIPGVTVVISTLGPSRHNPACHADLSKQYRILFTSYQKQKRRVALADFDKELDIKLISKDGTHPNDAGYVAVGNIFYDAVKRVEGQIQKPVNK